MSAAGRVVIGLDVGTTGTKSVAFDLDSPWRAEASREYPLEHPLEHEAIQDPILVRDRALASLAECVTKCGDREVLGVAVTTAMHGLIGLDHDRQPLTPLVTWADRRADEQVAAIRGTTLGRRLHADTGTPLHPMSPFAKITWYGRHESVLAERVRWWVGLKDWILLALTGEVVTELSSATGTGLWDRSAAAWSPTALELAGTTADTLPEVLSPTASLPLADQTAAATGLGAGTPVVLGAGDGPVGNLATRATRPGVAGMSIGTSGAVRAMVKRVPDDLPPSLFAYALTEDAWVVGGAVSNGGVVTRWVAETLVPDLADAPEGHDDAVLALAEDIPPGSDGLVLLPHLLAERAPLWDPDLQGAWLGVQHRHERAHFVRAAVEGVALQLALVGDQVDRVQPFTTLHATGGTLQAPLWPRVLAAMFDRPLRIATASGGTALGAAALGLFALDEVDDLDEAVDRLESTRAEEQVVEPEPAMTDAYRRARARIPALVEGLRPYADLLATRVR